jgi:hypothetical protein
MFTIVEDKKISQKWYVFHIDNISNEVTTMPKHQLDPLQPGIIPDNRNTVTASLTRDHGGMTQDKLAFL